MKLKISHSAALLGLLLCATSITKCSEKAEKFNGSKLHQAAMNNDIRKITRLLAQNADINALESRGRTALDIAILNNCFAAAETLIKSRADLKIAGDQHGNSPLHVASVNGNAAIVSLLLKHAPKCLVDQPDTSGNTPLMMALGNGNRYLVEGLLQNKADVTKCNLQGDGPLHSAVICATSTDALQVFLERADIDREELNRRNKNGLTALDRAIFKHNFPAAKLFLAKGAVVSCLPNKTNSLHLASATDFLEIERLFTPDVINSQDEDGFTPLHIAAQSGQVEVVAKLLCAGADSQVMNFSEETPLMSITHTPCLPTSRAIAELLLESNTGSLLVINGQPDILEAATFIVACQKGKLPLLQAFAAKRTLFPKILKEGVKLSIDLDNTDCAEFLTQQLHHVEEKFDQMPALVAIEDFLQDNEMPTLEVISSMQRGGSAAGGGH
jgi:ankyrin repeat protein